MTDSYSAAFDWARRHVDAGRLPTAVLGIATADGIVALDAFGATAGRAAKVDDHYRLFSITKPLVGLAAARAVERGLLGIETPLTAAVPEFGQGRDDVVRLRHLVSHTSGMIEPPLDVPQGLAAALRTPGRDFARRRRRRATRRSRSRASPSSSRTRRAGRGMPPSQTGPIAIGADGLTLDEASDPHTITDAEASGVDTETFVALRNPGAGLIGRA